MDLNWIEVVVAPSAIAGAAVGLSAYVAKALLGVRIEMLRQRLSRRNDAFDALRDCLAEISHCVDHMSEGNLDYADKCKELCHKCRRTSRQYVGSLGLDLVKLVRVATVHAESYARTRAVASHTSWGRSYRRIEDTMRKKESLFRAWKSPN